MRLKNSSITLYHALCAISLIGLVYGGIYKAFFVVGNIAFFDLTILSALSLLILICFGGNLGLTRNILLLTIICFTFFAVYYLSLLHSPSVVYGPQKAIACLGLLFSFFVGLVVPYDARTFFTNMIPYLGIVSGFAYFYVMSTVLEAADLIAFGGVSLSVGEIIGFGIVLLLCKTPKSAWVYFLLILSSLLLLALGARGPFVFAVAIFVLVLTINFFQKYDRLFKIIPKNILTIIFLVTVIATLYLLFVNNDEFTIFQKGLSRFYILFESDQGRSINIRKSMLVDAWHYIGEAPIFGYGLGSYGIVTDGLDARAYPHNVLLEIWFEAGIFSFLSFLLLVFASMACAAIRKDMLLICSIIFLALNFLKSSSLDELRLFFLVCGLSVGRTNNYKKSYY